LNAELPKSGAGANPGADPNNKLNMPKRQAPQTGRLAPAPLPPQPERSVGEPVLRAKPAGEPSVRPKPAPQDRPRSPVRAHADAPTKDPPARTRPGPRSSLSEAMAGHLQRFELRMPNYRRSPPIFSTAWFILAFALPVLLGAAYYGLIASKQYVSEFHFSVRQPLPDTQPSSQSMGDGGNLVALLGKSASANGAADTLDNYTVVDYIRSDQAARDLDERLNLRAMFSRAGIDPLAGYHGKAEQAERLAEYWRKMVWATYDPATGLAAVRVRAFAPADAYALATNLIDLSDGVVNGIGHRSRADSLRIAQQDVDREQAHMSAVRARLTSLRNQIGAVDPAKDREAGIANLAAGLRTALTEQEGQLDYLSRQLGDASAPQLERLKAQIAATQKQLSGVDNQFNRVAVGNSTLTAAVGEYEQLDAERKAVEQLLFQSLDRLQAATSDSDSQRLYLTTYVKPVTPEISTYPKRLESIGILALCCLLVWSVGVLIGKSVMDHVR
jgi:capsular polysaccharide transport system permease protein